MMKTSTRASMAAAALAALATIATTAGCSPGPNGITGITVDAGGNFVAVFAWCDGSALNFASLSRTDSSSTDAVIARYQAAQLPAPAASLRLDEPGQGWSVDAPVPPLVAGPEYAVFGRTGSSGGRTTYVRFHLADRDRLSPGTVLMQSYDRRQQKWVDALVSQADFDKRGRDYC